MEKKKIKLKGNPKNKTYLDDVEGASNFVWDMMAEAKEIFTEEEMINFVKTNEFKITDSYFSGRVDLLINKYLVPFKRYKHPMSPYESFLYALLEFKPQDHYYTAMVVRACEHLTYVMKARSKDEKALEELKRRRFFGPRSLYMKNDRTRIPVKENDKKRILELKKNGYEYAGYDNLFCN